MVLLSGEGGIGKSRLVQVLKDRVAEETHTRLECRSSPYYQNTAFYPLTDLFQRTLQWQQDDTSDEKLEKLEQTLSQYGLSLEEAVPLFAPLLSFRFPKIGILHLLYHRKGNDRRRWKASWLSCWNKQSNNLSFSSWKICTGRTLPPWSSRSYLTQITLNRLSRNQIERMAEHIGGGKRLPAEVLQQIVEKTDGVPLFVEEITKAILESGTLKDVNGQYEIVSLLPHWRFQQLSCLVGIQSGVSATDRIPNRTGVRRTTPHVGGTAM